MHLNTNSFRYYSGFRSMVHATLDFQSLPPWRRVPNCPEGTKRLVLLEPWQHHSVDTLGWRILRVRLSKTTAFLCSSMMFYVMMEFEGVKTCDLPWLFTFVVFLVYIYHVLSDFTLHPPGTHEVLRQVHDGVFQGHLEPQWLDRSPWSPSVKTALPKKSWYMQVWRKQMGHHWSHIGGVAVVVVVAGGGGVVAGVGVGVVVVLLLRFLLLIIFSFSSSSFSYCFCYCSCSCFLLLFLLLLLLLLLFVVFCCSFWWEHLKGIESIPVYVEITLNYIK